MPPFGTRFRGDIGSDQTIRAATDGTVGKGNFPDAPRVGRTRFAFRCATSPISDCAWDGVAEMEATMTWKTPSGGGYLPSSGRGRLCRAWRRRLSNFLGGRRGGLLSGP
jgi:hypothetical protein